MLNYLKQLIFPSTYSFSIVEVNNEGNFITVEDRVLGYKKDVGWGSKKLKHSKIIGEYEVLFTYVDGSSKIVKFLY
ncbi:hypothetical protein B0G85_1994 [Polynucleobacter brandtiae]|uniref:Uncharacterized protein n=1 Tax=Polynucleobacter brandtiae TaxID=1938816 RepID=A0A2M8VII4_9BURK|nr:hypothetical protein B0G85_1994 [Polynucleobacter brandtiae]